MPDQLRRLPDDKEALQAVALELFLPALRRRLREGNGVVENEEGWQIRDTPDWWVVCQADYPAPGSFFLRTKRLATALRATVWQSGKAARCPFDFPDEEWVPRTQERQ